MEAEHVLLCGGVMTEEANSSPSGKNRINLWPGVGKPNVSLNIMHLSDRFYQTVPEQFNDLIEIATYIFTGDQMFSRGEIDVDNFGGTWRRNFHYHIPVRALNFWRSAEVKKVLRETLEFLGDDFYDFTFYPAQDAPPIQNYLLPGVSNEPSPPEQVVLFSGGLDSLAGAIDEIINKKLRVALVTHRSTQKFNITHGQLNDLVCQKAGMFKPMIVQVEINKDKELGKERHQRVRSFLYAALGGTVAMMLGLRRLRFYENGVLSLNLPICGQIVGARATRTTHPRVLDGFQKLMSLLAGERFIVENPFLWQTKGDVVKRIVDAGCGSFIRYSRSCAHTWESSNAKPQCGTCSQCLDRRIAVLAAKAEQFDPLDLYKTDIFLEARPKDEDKILGAGFIERGNQVVQLRNVAEFMCRYPEVVKALPFTGLNAAAGAERFFALYQRHGAEVKDAVKRLMEQNAMAIVERTLPGESLLRSVYESGSVTSTPAARTKADSELSGEKATRNPVKAVEPAGSAEYALRRGSGVWRLVFDGGEADIQDGRGIALVAYLLFNPPLEPIHGTELASLVFGQTIIQEASLTADSDPTMRLVKEQAAEYMAILQDPTATEGEKAEALESLENLAEVAKVAKADSGSGAEKQVRAIRRAIERFITKLQTAKDRKNNPNKVLRAFGQHLHQYLWIPSSRFSGERGSRTRAKVAGGFTYEPPEGVKWQD